MPYQRNRGGCVTSVDDAGQMDSLCRRFGASR